MTNRLKHPRIGSSVKDIRQVWILNATPHHLKEWTDQEKKDDDTSLLRGCSRTCHLSLTDRRGHHPRLFIRRNQHWINDAAEAETQVDMIQSSAETFR